MKSTLSPEIREVAAATEHPPAISIIMPFEPKMNERKGLAQQLKLAVDSVNREIRENYRDDLAELVIGKLSQIVKNLNFSTFKKSIAIYVSPAFEKVFYLDIPLEEKINIDNSPPPPPWSYAKKEVHKHLVLILSGQQSKVYLGSSTTFVKVKSNVPGNIAAFKNDISERTAKFSDPSYKKEVLLKKFLHLTDEGLSFLLQFYNIPVFVMGTHKILEYFKALTKNENNISGYIPGNYEDASETELKNIIKPYIRNWKNVKIEDLRHQMEKAVNAGKLAAGMKDVWKRATQNRGRLLIVEKNFMVATEQEDAEDPATDPGHQYNKYSYIRDAVDDIIEKVLQHGGDVEFVDEGMLQEYGHIVLLQYY